MITIDGSPIKTESINGASIDLHLGAGILIEGIGKLLDLSEGDAPSLIQVDIDEEYGYELKPGQFILGCTQEMFNIPGNIAGHFCLKSSLARAFLGQELASWVDPYWHGSVLTLELFNNSKRHPLLLRRGMKVGQMVFFRGAHVPERVGYGVRGKYNNDKTVSGSKGLS